MAFFQNGLDGGGGDGGGGGGGGGGGSITTLNIFSAAVVNGPPNPISMGASETSGLYAAFDEDLGIVVSMENTMVFQGVRGAYNANSDQEWQDAQFPVPNPNYWLNTFGIDASEYELYANSNFEPEPLSDATPHSLQQFLDNEYYGGEYGTTTQRQSVFDPTMYNFATFGVVQTLDLIYNFDGTGLIINGEALEIAMYKDEWKKTVTPIEFRDVTAKHWLLREWHSWFSKNNISRLDYEIFASTDERALGVPSEHKAQVWILDETVRALFKLTFFKG